MKNFKTVLSVLSVSLSLGAILCLRPVLGAETGTESTPEFLAHLLDYLARDYGGAVKDGKVLSESEYHEQIEFAENAVKLGNALSVVDAATRADLATLLHSIQNKADAEVVSSHARSLQGKIIAAAHISIAPSEWPDLARGRDMFASNCSTCHGAEGRGDGPAGIHLDPKPANFHKEEMSEISPFQAFSTIRLGVPGTGMAPNPALTDKEAWALAFYVISLRHMRAATDARELESVSLQDAATKSDRDLKAILHDRSNEEKQGIIASVRNRSGGSGGGHEIELTKSLLMQARDRYLANDVAGAKTLALKAYLDGFESIEPRLVAAAGSTFKADAEEKMAAVRAAIERGASTEDLVKAYDAAIVMLTQSGEILGVSGISPWVSFAAAAAIILREGFEAVLVILALLGVIRAAGTKKAARYVHGGWMAALGLGFVTWFFSGWLMGISGAQREMMEAVTALFAVCVLLYVGFWLHSQSEIGRWKAFIDGKVKKALRGKNLWGLLAIAFIAVFREAFETVLFLRAIWIEGGDSSRMAMASGVFSSLVFILVCSWLLLRTSARLPIRKLFTASAVIMAALAFIFTGKGFHSLQETGSLKATFVPSLTRIDLIGLYPTWETLIPQIAVSALVMSLWFIGKRPSRVTA